MNYLEFGDKLYDLVDHTSPLPPNSLFGFLLHDFQTGDYWGANKIGYNRVYPTRSGRPETVKTHFKEDRVSLTPAWQDFHKLMFTLCAFGEANLNLFPELEQAFSSAMAPNRVITNHRGWPEGYMCLCMGGNFVKLLDDKIYRPNSNFGYSYKIETLDGSKTPPDVEDVFYNKPWLWSKATNLRYAFPEDNISGLENPWQHVIPFPQLGDWNAHTPLLNITNYGWNYVQVPRVRIWQENFVPNPYNPPIEKTHP